MNHQVTRRKLLAGGGAAILASTAFSVAESTSQEKSELSESKRKFSTISGSSDDFAAHVELLYPGLMSNPTFREIAPIALLVTYKGDVGVRAFSVSWTVYNAKESSDYPVYIYHSLGSPATGHTLSSLASARRDILQDGQSRLVTPFFNWTPSYYAANAPMNWARVLRSTEPGTFIVSAMASGGEVGINLDAAVFSDWKSIGSDRHQLARKLWTRRNAEHDEALVVCRLLRQHASDDEITKTLRDHASAPRSTNRDLNTRWYEQSRRLHARILLKAFDDMDRKDFRRAVIRLKRQRKTVITKFDE